MLRDFESEYRPADPSRSAAKHDASRRAVTDAAGLVATDGSIPGGDKSTPAAERRQNAGAQEVVGRVWEMAKPQRAKESYHADSTQLVVAKRSGLNPKSWTPERDIRAPEP